jgi:hypothetical protein
MFQVFSVFHMYVASVSFGCCIGLQWFQVFWQVFQIFISSVSSFFFCMLQQLHLHVSKVYRVLHMGCTWKADGGAGDVRGGVGDVRGGTDPLLERSLTSPTTLGCALARAAGTIRTY